MSRLLRPPIPLPIRLRVLLRQLGEMWIDDVVAVATENRSLGTFVSDRLVLLAEQLGCDPSRLHLDHDPALGARRKIFNADGEHVEYDPPANSPDHLIYREKIAHDVKTRIRGERGQYSDIVLIKRNRRLERREAEREGRAPPSKSKPKRPIPKRPNAWGKKGSRRFPKRRDKWR